MAYRPSLKRKAAPKPIEPNFTPVMNLMVVLIPMLLSVAQFVRVSLLDYQPPPAEDLASAVAEPTSNERLDLVVNVLPSGFEISLFGATSGKNFRTIGLTRDGHHNINALQRELIRIRRDVVGAPRDTVDEVDPLTGSAYRRPVWNYSDAEVVSIAARGNTDWQLVVKVMDATREYVDKEGRRHPLFPLPRLGQIQ